MKKIFDDRGFLTEEGKYSKQMKDFIIKTDDMLEGYSINELRIMGSILHKIVGDAVCDAIQFKTNETNKFTAMSDEEFDKYLADKYAPIYGKNWLIKASITDEEGERNAQTFRRQMTQNLEDLKKRPREQHYGLKLSPRDKTRFR
jgi:hypothetical protein